jgi:hypothetical protein
MIAIDGNEYDGAGQLTFARHKTDVLLTAVADDLSGLLSASLPSLYEQLVLSYRWKEIDLVGFVCCRICRLG